MVAEVIELTGARFVADAAAPTILRRIDREFIPNILRGLSTAEGRAAIAQTALPQTTIAHTADGGMKLYQPVHQIFHVTLLQALCQRFGSPRLDPARIESCGLVVRRVSQNRGSPTERWSRKNGTIVGWVPCPHDDLDPDPDQRERSISSGHPEIDRRLPLPASIYDGINESVAPLFRVPPTACDAANATMMYGLVPVTSNEKGEIFHPPSFDQSFAKHLPEFLQPGGSLALAGAGRTLKLSDAEDPSLNPPVAPDQQRLFEDLVPFLEILRQFKFEFGAFGDDPEGRNILAALNQFEVAHVGEKLGDFLKNAAAVLIDRPSPGAPSPAAGVQMPAQWPDLPSASRAHLADLIQKTLEARLRSITAGEGRFDAPGRYYRLRAFVRVKQLDGCPPRIVWSGYSQPFQIAAWHESSDQPPIKIQLPRISANLIKTLKPNVAFAVDSELYNKLQRDPKKALKGESAQAGSSTLEWICAFNIPIITICAFIVLNLFLSLFALFDFFFELALMLKVCIPIPSSSNTTNNNGGAG